MVENLTYRWRGHSKSDRNLYRTPEEIQEWQSHDPIPRFANLLIEAKILSKEEVDAIDTKSQTLINEAAEKAIGLPEPSPENMEAEVYAL